jgi:hypothetical protein
MPIGQNGQIPEESVSYPSEIDIIEEALREAKLHSGTPIRREFGPSDALLGDRATPTATSPAPGSLNVPTLARPGDSYTEEDLANVIAYGKQLKSWVDVQVDCRMEAWFATRAEESARTIAGLQQTDFEVQAVKELQAKHFAVVESLSQELQRIKSSIASADKALEKTMAALGDFGDDVGRLRKTVASCESAIKDISAETKQARREVSLEHKQVESLEMQLQRRIEDRLGEDLANLQRRLVAELRAETAGALQSESDAVARLDQRMWLLSQRVDRRIGDVSTRVEREPLALANSARILSRSLSPREPRNAVYSPRWNIIGGRLISSEEVDDPRPRNTIFPLRSKLALLGTPLEDVILAKNGRGE